MEVPWIVRFLILCCTTMCTLSMIANPNPINMTLPNGKRVTTKLKGDEYLHWLTDDNDYTIVTGNDGYFYYGTQLSNGRVGSTGIRVDLSSPPSGLSKNIKPSQTALKEICQGKFCQNGRYDLDNGNRYLRDGKHRNERRKLTMSKGTVFNLVVPIRFADHHKRKLPTRAQIAVLMNHVGAHSTLCPTGSVRDVFKRNSYGALNLTSVVVDWVNVTGTESYWANGDRGITNLTHSLIRQALSLADPYVNFAKFDTDGDKYIDAITFVHSGYGAEWGGDGYMNRIWSHKWSLSSASGAYVSAEGVSVYDYHISPALWGLSGSEIGHIGVIAHETGHYFGLPDMYDGKVGDGVGSWELMSNSWGFPGDQLYPPHLSIYSRIALGWDSAATIGVNGVYRISATEDQNPTYPRGYKITKNFPAGEYLLIENRQKLYFDSMIPASGIVIYHVDEKTNHTTEGYPGQSGWPSNGQHYKISILAPDGRYDLEKGFNNGDSGDIWTAGSAGITYSSNADPKLGPNFPNTDAYQGGKVYKTYISITNITASGTTMSFRLKIGP